MKIPQIESTLHHIWILTPRSIFSSNSSKSLLDRWGDSDRRHHPWKGAPAISALLCTVNSLYICMQVEMVSGHIYDCSVHHWRRIVLH